MRCRAIAALILAFGAGCESGSEPSDPLDPELIRELSLEQGNASGDAHSGTFALQFSPDTCDCPSFEYEGQTIDPCATEPVGLAATLTEGSGVLAMTTQLGLFTGAIEVSGGFVVAGIRDLATVAGPLESVHRLDGQFSDENSADGWAGQRLIGEQAGERIDCRWTGSFVLVQN